MGLPGCPLCEAPEVAVFAGPKFRLVRAEEPGFPAFYRLVWHAHVAEFSDLPQVDRLLCMEAVAQVERLLLEHLKPAKVNLASLGNMVPHLHWHIVARFAWDSHFPAPVWAAALRSPPAAAVAAIEAVRPVLEQALRSKLSSSLVHDSA